jgi:hypothetical protein
MKYTQKSGYAGIRSYLTSILGSAAVGAAVLFGGLEARAQDPLKFLTKTVLIDKSPLPKDQKDLLHIDNMLDVQREGTAKYEAEQKHKESVENQEKIIKLLEEKKAQNGGNNQSYNSSQSSIPAPIHIMTAEEARKAFPNQEDLTKEFGELWQKAKNGDEKVKKDMIIMPAGSTNYVSYDVFTEKSQENDAKRNSRGFFGRAFNSKTAQDFERNSERYFIYGSSGVADSRVKEGWIDNIQLLRPNGEKRFIRVSQEELGKFYNSSAEERQNLVIQLLSKDQKTDKK